MINHYALQQKIIATEGKIKETKKYVEESSYGPVEEALLVVIPMMEDQLELMKDLLDYAAPRG